MTNTDEAPASSEALHLMTVPEVAAHLKVSQMTVRRLISAESLPHVRLGEGSIRVVESDLAQFIEDRRRPGSRPAEGGPGDA